jgi:proline iminopeptidase
MALIQPWNGEFSGKAMFIGEYYRNFKPLAESVEVPVLFFYGSKDHAIGAEHYKDIMFPNMLLYKYKGSHVPFIEGMADLEKAISAFIKKFKFTI